ncbi:condensation domain-containing protein [Streptomyces sp. NBC_01176]|uniref:condensation domain-containing protein n=1 Tax=Streptomyces sp. NBC_01176 TaxID=2903760 RepID=UPI003866896D|nr:condensation domain-containing protein [Streptomyces sp. NBC_01176]WSS89280.1 condensation domain-containing protein [Streptomyces sp. NBC_01176]
MLTPTPLEELLDLAADVIGCDRRVLPAAAAGSPFITLGGGLGQAVRLQARAEQQLGLAVDLAQLLGPAPLADVLARARPAPVRAPGPAAGGGGVRALLPGQSAALAAERVAGAGAVARIVSAELSGPLDAGALRRALAALGARHEGLRTAFATTPRGPVRRVLAVCPPPLVMLEPLAAGPGEDLVAAAHARLAVRAGRLVGRPGLPPLVFALTPLAAGAQLLSFVHHDAVADSRSAALLWQELLADYDRAVRRRPLDHTPRPGPDAPHRTRPAARPGPARVLPAERAEQLRSLAGGLDLAPAARPAAAFDYRGEQLLFGLGTRLRDAADATARRAGVPHGTVLLAAWALAVGRRAGRERLLVGTEMPRRPTAELLRTVVPCSATVPVACELAGGVDYFLRGIACAFSEALQYADVDDADTARAAGVPVDRFRAALTQVTFAARDELLPESMRAGGLSARFHHGHPGAVTADAALTVLRWREHPLLSLEFASAQLTRAQAAQLARALRAALTALVTSPPHTPVEDLPDTPAARDETPAGRPLALPLP